MSDTIERSAAIDALRKTAMSYSSCFSDWMMTYQKALKDGVDAIEELPPAQPQRMRGRWVYERADMYRCSECEHIHTSFDLDKCDADFCPHCGADMRYERGDRR